jgi:hypothetical protein
MVIEQTPVLQLAREIGKKKVMTYTTTNLGSGTEMWLPPPLKYGRCMDGVCIDRG